MKILHCADIHLDSAMTANLDKDKAKERKSELLASFKDMVAYAVKENIRVIIIAGDLFDTRNISVGAKKEVYNIIINNPDIMFYYLQGNHDNGSFLAFLEEVPDNLRMFGKEWTSYNAGVIDNGSIIKMLLLPALSLTVIILERYMEVSRLMQAIIILLYCMGRRLLIFLKIMHR